MVDGILLSGCPKSNVDSVTQSSVKKAPQAENFQILHWFSKMISDFLSFPNHNGFYTTLDFYTTLSCMCPSASEFPPSTIKFSACYLKLSHWLLRTWLFLWIESVRMELKQCFLQTFSLGGIAGGGTEFSPRILGGTDPPRSDQNAENDENEEILPF